MSTDVVALDSVRARKLTDQIKVAVDATWQLVAEAYTSRAWEALGYTSWDDYTTREFGTSRLRLPREERQEIVSSLRDQGLSIPAIAAATGLGVGTVHRALPSSAFPIGKPEPELVIDHETGEVLNERVSTIVDTPATAVDDVSPADPIPTPEPVKPITGTDGKTYQPKVHRAPYRKPLPDVARNSGWELRKATERVEKLFDDDRYRTNEKQVADALRGHLLYVAETVAAVLDQLP